MVFSPSASGANLLRLTAAKLEGPGWTIAAPTLALDLDAPVLDAKVSSVAFESIGMRTGATQVRCVPRLHPGRIGCTQGELSAAHPWLSTTARGLSLEFLPESRHAILDIEELPSSAGNLRVTLESVGPTQRYTIKARALDAAKLSAMAHELMPRARSVTAAGRIALDLQVERTSEQRLQMKATVQGHELVVADGSGLREAQGLDASIAWEWSGSQWPMGGFSARAEVNAGAAYLNPLYLEPGAGEPWRLKATGRMEDKQLLLSSATLSLGQILNVEGAGVLPFADPAAATGSVGLATDDVRSAFSTLIAPFLAGTPADGLELHGSAQARAVLRQGAPTALSATLEELDVGDLHARLGIQGLTASFQWAERGGPWPGHLGWRGGDFYRLPFGSTSAAFELGTDAVTLLQPTHVPLLDGEIILDTLIAERLGESASWELSGRISGIDLAALTTQLQWPPLAGDLSGVVPSARYRDARFEVGGALLVRVFGGTVTITDLVLDRPLGPVPRFRANLDLADVDLERLTRAFSLGRIQGKLEGYLRDLELVDWRPARFDGYLGTPNGDPSRHRISQRAVNEIAALGGSPAPLAALSRGVLRLFNQFSYRRLGIGCKLRDGICQMEGVAPAGEGYYLVQGSGLPQINVMGFERRVDWEDLVARVVAASKSEGPVIGSGENP
jgi:hypothetical protein